MGILSIVTVVVCIIFFFVVRGPNVNLPLVIGVLISFSVLGIIFAIISKKLWFMITGIILNSAVLVVAYLLLIAVGISEP
nr:hypothetical protein [Saliterribacillus persicus]